jgi:hypothetical protein
MGQFLQRPRDVTRKVPPPFAESIGMKTWKEAGWKGRTKLILFSLVPTLVLLILAEFAANLTIYRDIRVEEDPLAGGQAVYRMRFGKAWWGKESQTPLNSLGFPDREFSSVGPKGDCVHVVFAGDSFTFGDAVDRHRNFVSLVERAMARRYPDACLRVFNLGERMTTIDRQAEHIRSTLQLLDPDLVIVGQYQNDLTDLTNPGAAAYEPPPPPDSTAGIDGNANFWGDVVRNRVPFSNAALIRLLSYHAFAFLVTSGIEYDVLAQWSVLEDPRNQAMADRLTGIYREIHLDLLEELRARGTEVGVLIFPSKLDIMAKRAPEDAFFRALAEEAETPYLSLFNTLNENRSPYTYQMYDGHLSEAGNALVARDIFDWLAPTVGQSPFSSLEGLSKSTEDAGVGTPPGVAAP